MKTTNLNKGMFGNITSYSKKVRKGDIFVAIKGERYDGHDYVGDALKRGACLCLVSGKSWRGKGKIFHDAPIVQVEDTRKELSKLAADLFDKPSGELNVVGITGTNGKTTVSLLAEKIFSDAGFNTGVVGTVFYKVGRKFIHAERTTPDAVTMQGLLRRMVKTGVNYALMEISSHALKQKRADHVYYDTAVFTNLTPEHLDYHRNMRSYFLSKAKLFNNLKSDGTAILNEDDPYTAILKKRIPGRVLTYSVKGKADISAKGIHMTIHGSRFKAVTPYGTIQIRTPMIGRYNISNILAGISIAYVNDIDPGILRASVKDFGGPPGRLEAIDAGQAFKVFIDYAHTKDALSNVLSAIRPYVRNNLITVFGCGGNRDRSKRPQMGKVAARFSDNVIITNDNPRSEKPRQIAKEIQKGIGKNNVKCSIILDRRNAIKSALGIAGKGDAVLIAGKGHETTQTIGDVVVRFDDAKVARRILSVKRKVQA